MAMALNARSTVEQLAEPWRMFNSREAEVEAACAEVGYKPGEVAAIAAALREVRRTIREGIAAGRVMPWSSRPVERQVPLALVGAALGAALAKDLPGLQNPAAGIQTALLFLIAVAQVGWAGRLFECAHCGAVGVASRSDKKWCSDLCRMRTVQGVDVRDLLG